MKGHHKTHQTPELKVYCQVRKPNRLVGESTKEGLGQKPGLVTDSQVREWEQRIPLEWGWVAAYGWAVQSPDS